MAFNQVVDMDFLKLAEELMLDDDANSSGISRAMAEEGLSWGPDMLLEDLPSFRGGVGFRDGDEIRGVQKVVESFEFGFKLVGITTKGASKISANPANRITIRQGRVITNTIRTMHRGDPLSATRSVADMRGLGGTTIPQMNCIEKCDLR